MSRPELDYRAASNDSKQFLLRGVYNLSKRSAVYAAVGRIDNDGTAAVALSAGAGLNQNGIITGIKHSF